MIALGILQLIYAVILLITVPFGGIIDVLPFGMQPAVDLFAGTLQNAFAVAPFIETPFTLIMWAIGIKIALVSLGYIMWIIERIR